MYYYGMTLYVTNQKPEKTEKALREIGKTITPLHPDYHRAPDQIPYSALLSNGSVRDSIGSIIGNPAAKYPVGTPNAYREITCEPITIKRQDFIRIHIPIVASEPELCSALAKHIVWLFTGEAKKLVVSIRSRNGWSYENFEQLNETLDLSINDVLTW